ncbi:MAG TPA: ATP-dependent Clp protease ATP-binding subunit, partial [Candidatus Moranbacteria bacterium]|nr:ATP-dependent Clp protease ATP-binding subunit [Candidatus Moranbacteria bacterium]
MNLSRLSKSARECFRQAQKIAASRGSAVVTEADFLLAVLLAKSAAGRHLLANFNIDEKVILSALPRTRPRGKKFSAHEKSARTQTIDTDLKTALIAAYKIAGRGGYPYVGTEHLVVAILGGDDSFAYRIRQAVGLKEEFLDNLLGGLGATSVGEAEGETALFEKKKTPGNLSSELSKMFEKMENPEPPSARERESALEYFCRDLTAEEDIGELIGRERELERVITILCRREKQNPLLVGDPGVGKTALVEGLARRISTGKVPAPLLEARILSVDLTALVAGTTFRGEFEARLRDLIAEAEEDGRVILFIDELHTIVGTGNVQGSLDAANILKPAL